MKKNYKIWYKVVQYCYNKSFNYKIDWKILNPNKKVFQKKDSSISLIYSLEILKIKWFYLN